MPYIRSVVGAVASGAVALSGFSIVLFAPQAAHAEKTAEQIECEEAGGTWVDKGEGNTFCFKKLPPMSKADGLGGGGGGSGGVAAECEVQTAREAGSGLATGRSAACDMAINTKGTGAAGRNAGPEPRDCDDDNDGAADRTAMAIKTKGTGAQRTVGAADVDQDGALDVCGMAINEKGTSVR